MYAQVKQPGKMFVWFPAEGPPDQQDIHEFLELFFQTSKQLGEILPYKRFHLVLSVRQSSFPKVLNLATTQLLHNC